MSRRGNCLDNGCSETLFGALKIARSYGQHFALRRHARNKPIAWLPWDNKARLHLTLAYINPMQCESQWLAKPVNP